MSSLRKMVMSVLFLVSFMAVNLYSLGYVAVNGDTTLQHDVFDTCFVINVSGTSSNYVSLNLNNHIIWGPGQGIGVGVNVIGKTNVQIINGTIRGFNTGILFKAGGNVEVYNVSMNSVNYGIFDSACYSPYINCCTINSGVMGVFLSESNDAQVNNCDLFYGSYGLYVQACSGLIVRKTDCCYNSSGYGMYLNGAPWVEVSGCTFEENTTGVKMENTWGGLFMDYQTDQGVYRTLMKYNSNMGLYIKGANNQYNTFNHCDMRSNTGSNIVDQGSNNTFTNCDY